jgi:hypothetical protein
MVSFCLIQSCWTCTRHVPKRCTLINVINKCCTLFVFFVWILALLRQGIARGSPPGTTTEVLRVGFPFREIRFVSVGTRAMLDHRTSLILRECLETTGVEVDQVWYEGRTMGPLD